MAAEEIFGLFQNVCKQLHETRALLADACETIDILDSELAHIKASVQYYSGLVPRPVDETGSLIGQAAQFTTTPSITWIEDLWLSVSSEMPILHDAEQAWMENALNPQAALNAAGLLLVRERELSRRDHLTCILFQSAILLSIGRLDDSYDKVKEVIQECALDWRYKDLRSIAYWLRGRNFMARNEYRAAFWDFSLAIFADGYRERAREYRDQAETRMRQTIDGAAKSSTSSDDLSSKTEDFYALRDNLDRFSFQNE